MITCLFARHCLALSFAVSLSTRSHSNSVYGISYDVEVPQRDPGEISDDFILQKVSAVMFYDVISILNAIIFTRTF